MSPDDLSAPDTRGLLSWDITGQARAALPILLAAPLTSGCTTVCPPAALDQSSRPVLSGWFEGEEVFHITTGVSRADVAQAKEANFAPRLGLALPEGRAVPGRSQVDKVYAVTNFKPDSVFASAPSPMGSTSRSTAYGPLCRGIDGGPRQLVHRASARVLVMDDDETIRIVVQRMLERLGCASDACCNGEEAVAPS